MATLRRVNLKVREIDLGCAGGGQAFHAEADLPWGEVGGHLPDHLIVDLEDKVGTDGITYRAFWIE